MKANAKDVQARISEVCSHLTFEFNGHNCGVDPLSPICYNMWCDERDCTVYSIDTVMETPFFDGQSLASIAESIDIIDW